MPAYPPDQLRSALFLDFDNIFSSLQEMDPEYAHVFARYPSQWLNWLIRHATGPAKSQDHPRRILYRKCYLNPQAFHEYRPFFIKAAFDVIDCPPLTQRGKTSTDIHIVMDIIEALNFPIHFDEFLILSGDADFTPVLIKLREHDRITTVLSTGFTSLAYISASTHLIDRERFILSGLGFGKSEEEPVTPAALDVDKLYIEAARVVRDMVAEYPFPVAFAPLAQEVQTTLADDFSPTTDWYGHDKFSTLLAKLDLDPLEISWTFPGYVYDPGRHDFNSTESFDAMGTTHPDLAPLARKVHELTDTPYLLPEHYKGLFEAIAQEVTENDFSLTRTSRNVRDRCRAQGLPISRAQVNFVLIGIGHTGYRYGEQTPESPLGLAKAFAQNVNYLCRTAQFLLDPDETKLFLRWLVAKQPVAPPNGGAPKPIAPASE
ncbi:MAG: NYN domain-containing protein [Desulfovibrionaceae bacterium]